MTGALAEAEGEAHFDQPFVYAFGLGLNERAREQPPPVGVLEQNDSTRISACVCEVMSGFVPSRLAIRPSAPGQDRLLRAADGTPEPGRRPSLVGRRRASA
jgi:hypothetical protein